MRPTTILTSLLFMLFSTAVFAQGGHFSAEEAKLIKNSTVYFILEEEGSAYNQAIKDAVTHQWKYSKFEFADMDQCEQLLRDESAFVFTKVNFTTTIGDKPNPMDERIVSSHEYDGLGLIKGRKKLKQIVWKDWGAYIFLTDDEDQDDYLYKLPMYLKTVQDVLERQAKGQDLSKGWTDTKQYDSSRKELKSKTLYIAREELPKLKKKVAWGSELKSAYGYKLEIVSREELAAKIKTGEEGAVFNWVVNGSTRFYPFVTDIASGKTYYFTMERNYMLNPAKYGGKVLTAISK